MHQSRSTVFRTWHTPEQPIPPSGAINALTALTHPDGTAFDMAHDGLGRPISIADPVEVRYLVGYAAHGGVIGDIRNNRSLMLYGYGPLYRLGWIAMGHDFPGYIEDLWILLDRNPAGQISSAFRRNDPYVWTGHYGVNRAYATNGLNQYSAAGTASFTYDANGNLTSDGTNTFTYDIENRLVARSPSSGSGGTGGVALGYDPLGRLLAVASPTTYTRFLYDGDALVEEYNGNNALTRRYVHNEGADVPLLSYAGAAITQPSYLHADHQGSIVGVSDPTGAVAPNTYDEYGIPGASNTGRFQYTGQIWIPELGMYHYKARVYSPTLGRFLQTDPIGYQDQFNLYAYVGNDPMNGRDPTGTKCEGDRERGYNCKIDGITELTRSGFRIIPIRADDPRHAPGGAFAGFNAQYRRREHPLAAERPEPEHHGRCRSGRARVRHQGRGGAELARQPRVRLFGNGA